MQIEVKFVPGHCAADGRKYYQFTAKDECTRWTFRGMYAEYSSARAKDFLEKLERSSPMRCWLRNRSAKHCLKKQWQKRGASILESLRPNGKVERQHRIDEQRFYKRMRMYSLADGRKQPAIYQRELNHPIMTCLEISQSGACALSGRPVVMQVFRLNTPDSLSLFFSLAGSFLLRKSPPFPGLLSLSFPVTYA